MGVFAGCSPGETLSEVVCLRSPSGKSSLPEIRRRGVRAPHEMDGRGNLAYVRGAYSLAIPMGKMMEPIHDSGKYIEMRRKQADGSWLIALDIYNCDLEQPEM